MNPRQQISVACLFFYAWLSEPFSKAATEGELSREEHTEALNISHRTQKALWLLEIGCVSPPISNSLLGFLFTCFIYVFDVNIDILVAVCVAWPNILETSSEP